MGLSLFTHAPNRALTALQLDKSIAKARKHHAHYAMLAKQAKTHLKNLQIAANAFEALTTQRQGLETQLHEARAALDHAMEVEMRELCEELVWSRRYHRPGGGADGSDVVSRAPDTVVAEIVVLSVRIEDDKLKIDALQRALEAKQEALVCCEAECRDLEEVTARCAEHLGPLADDLELRPLTLRRALENRPVVVDGDGDDQDGGNHHRGAAVIEPLTLGGDRGTGLLRPLTRSMVSFDEFMGSAQQSSLSLSFLVEPIDSVSSSQLLSPPGEN